MLTCVTQAYDIMKRGLGLSSTEIGDGFAKWTRGVLGSFPRQVTPQRQ